MDSETTKSKKRTIVGVEFPPAMIQDLRSYANKDDRKVAYLIRAACGLYLEKRRVAEQAEKENTIAAMLHPSSKPEPAANLAPVKMDVRAASKGLTLVIQKEGKP